MVGTLDEHVARLRQEKALQEMTPLDKAIVGAKATRAEIPLTDRYLIGKMAELLHGVAAEMAFAAQRKDWPDRTVFMETQTTVRQFNHRVREMHGLSKFNTNGTTKE